MPNFLANYPPLFIFYHFGAVYDVKFTAWGSLSYIKDISELVASLCAQEYKEVVGGTTSQPPAAHARVGLAAPLATGSNDRSCHGDCSPSSPDPPGWIPCDRTDPPPGVQPTELHGAGSSDFRRGERRRMDGSKHDDGDDVLGGSLLDDDGSSDQQSCFLHTKPIFFIYMTLTCVRGFLYWSLCKEIWAVSFILPRT